MAYIKTLKDNELIGGTNNDDVYPISSTQAIYSQSPDGTVPSGIRHQKLEDRLEDHEADSEELHRKTEKLKAVIVNSKNAATIEITDSNGANDFVINLTGKAYLETYGDAEDEVVPLNDATVIEKKRITKDFYVTYGSAGLELSSQYADGDFWKGTCDLSQGAAKKTIGNYNVAFAVSYLGTSKTVGNSTYIGLRLFAGFTSEESQTIDTDIDTWAEFAAYIPGMAYSSENNNNKVVLHDGATPRLVFPAVSGDVNPDTRYIHFAVPAPLKVTKITQPDGLGQELAFTDPHIVLTRVVGEQNYDYNLYRTTLPQFSWRQLRLDVTLSK